MHKKIFLISSFIFAFATLMSPCLFASYVDSSTGLYTFTSRLLAQWLSYEDSGDNWVEIFNYTNDITSAPTVNVAAGSAGTQIGTFMSGAVIPTGTIKRIKVRIGQTAVKGWVKSGTNYYVTDNTVADLQTRNFGTTQPTESDCSEITMNGPGGAAYSDQTQTISIVAVENATINISVEFTLGNALTVEDVGGGNYVIHPSNDFMPTITQI